MNQSNRLVGDMSEAEVCRVVRLSLGLLLVASVTGCLSVPRMETSERAYVCGSRHQVAETVVRVLDAPQWKLSEPSDCPSGSMLTPVAQQAQQSQLALDGVLKQSALQLRGLPIFGRPGETLPVPPWMKAPSASGSPSQGRADSGSREAISK